MLEQNAKLKTRQWLSIFYVDVAVTLATKHFDCSVIDFKLLWWVWSSSQRFIANAKATSKSKHLVFKRSMANRMIAWKLWMSEILTLHKMSKCFLPFVSEVCVDEVPFSLVQRGLVLRSILGDRCREATTKADEGNSRRWVESGVCNVRVQHWQRDVIQATITWFKCKGRKWSTMSVQRWWRASAALITGHNSSNCLQCQKM